LPSTFKEFDAIPSTTNKTKQEFKAQDKNKKQNKTKRGDEGDDGRGKSS
jgi:hypothetical protein